MPIPAGLLAALNEARHVCVLTGSGVSAESGVPTFREAQTGLWEQYDPHQLATPEAFQRDPALVWRWYRWRRELVAAAEPNPGHHALAAMARRVPELTLITQNVDGLHQRAGSDGVIEFHGNLFEDRCFAEGSVVSGADLSAEVPRCPDCGGPLRPGVVWFGETIPEHALQAAAAAVNACDVFVSIGTSALVWPAAGLADAAREQGAVVVEINLDATPLSSRTDYCLQGKSGSLLPELLDCLNVQ
ncbi:MAG: NAD-dependent deacylase [Woeseiaceae bacterium]|nr:NAD-dependent deacylase [Woeseiaceae bacterium]